jgi:hypothetical protein
MATLTIPNSYAPGEVIEAGEMNANFTAVKNFAEGLSTGANFDAGAINTEDIAASAITEAKIATAAVTTSKIASSVTLTTPNIGAATGTSLVATGQVTDSTTINTQTGNYTLVIGDAGKFITVSAAGSSTVTIPLNSSVGFSLGTKIVIARIGAGAVAIAGAVGVTVNATPGLNLRAQYSAATCIQISLNSWLVLGDLSS